MSYYKTSRPETLAAIAAYQAEAKKLHDDADALAAMFPGSKPILLSNDTGIRFAGLRFGPHQDRDVWRAPGTHGEQSPRAKASKASAKEAHAAVMATWKAHAPTQRVERESIYAAIGTDWQSVLFCGMGYFLRDGVFYVETDAKLGDWMVEILGSEFNAANDKTPDEATP